jgi:hypothetical protein
MAEGDTHDVPWLEALEAEIMRARARRLKDLMAETRRGLMEPEPARPERRRKYSVIRDEYGSRRVPIPTDEDIRQHPVFGPMLQKDEDSGGEGPDPG